MRLIHCAGCQFLYGLSIVMAGVFLQFLFLNSPLILIGAFVTVGGLYNVFRGFLHIRRRNELIKTMVQSREEDFR